MIVSITRSELSEIHFWQRFITAARPSKPSASQPGWARARALGERGDLLGRHDRRRSAITCPVAGFSTSMVVAVVAGASVTLIVT